MGAFEARCCGRHVPQRGWMSRCRSGVAMLALALSAWASLAFAPPALAHGGQSIAAASLPLRLTLTNGGAGTQSVASVTASAGFSVPHDCGSSAAGASCAIDVEFTLAVAGNAAGKVTASGSFGTLEAALAGS